MTKKHFIALANVMREHKPGVKGIGLFLREDTLGALREWESIRDSLADFCASQNPRFNRERWLGYIAGECGSSGGKRT